MSSHVDLIADVIADALTAEHISYYGDRCSKTVKAYYRRVLYRIIARGGSPPIVGGHALSSIAGTSYKPRTPHGTKANTPVLTTTSTKSVVLEAAYESYMNPEPGFQSGPGTL